MAERKSIKQLKKEVKAALKEEDDDCNVGNIDSAIEIAVVIREELLMRKLNGLQMKDSGADQLGQTSGIKDSVEYRLLQDKTYLTKVQMLCLLLKKLPSSSVLEDTKIMKDIWFLSRTSALVRALFGRISSDINQLLNSTSVQRSYADVYLQVVMASIVLNISGNEDSKTKIVKDCPQAMAFLIACLRSPRIDTRITAVTIVSGLSTVQSISNIIGNSGAIRALVELVEQDNVVCLFDAAGAILNLCRSEAENRKRAVSDGAVIAFSDKIIGHYLIEEMLRPLAMLSRHQSAIPVLKDKEGILECLFKMLGQDATVVTEEVKEYCMLIIHAMYVHSDVAKINELQNARQTLQTVAITGSMSAKGKATHLLSRLQKLS